MELERCYSVLAVSSSQKFNESIRGLLPESRYFPVTVMRDAASARRELLEQSYDLVVINAPLTDEFGTRLALDVWGVLALSKPTSSQLFAQSVRMLCITRERLRSMEKKTATIEEKMEEIRLVNRAKWLLIEELKMTEQEAHRYIEKQAMDRCVTKRVVAEQIMSTYK